MKRILFDYRSVCRSQRRAANDIAVTELVQHILPIHFTIVCSPSLFTKFRGCAVQMSLISGNDQCGDLITVDQFAFRWMNETNKALVTCQARENWK